MKRILKWIPFFKDEYHFVKDEHDFFKIEVSMTKKIILLLLALVTCTAYANESINNVSFVPVDPEANEITPRIIGGTVADFNEFKFYARLVFTDYDSSYFHLCGATLLNDQYVLTAAHCVDSRMTGIGQENLAIVVNNADFSDVSLSELKTIDSIYIHPYYDDNGYVNDIAIIKLFSKLTENIEFVSLPTDDDKLYYEQLATMSVTGMGYIDNSGTFPETLLTTEVSLLSDSECSSLVAFYFAQEFIASNSLCVIPIDENGSCSGDSGGPLTYVDSDGKNQQAGLVSYGGAVCAAEGIPNVYTELHGYREWVENTISSNSIPPPISEVSNTDSGGGSVNRLLLLTLFYIAIFRRKCRLA